MIRKNRGGEEGGGDAWMNTYADMVTLLLTFFAVLLSMSSVNQEKFNAFIRSFSNLPPEVIEELINPGDNPEDSIDPLAPTPEEVTQAMFNLYEKLSQYVAENGMQDAISIQKVNNIIYVRFDSSIFFAPDEAVMLEGSEKVLDFIGDGIKQYERMIERMAVCGHTATVSEDYPVDDWMLSSQRAAVVAMFFDKQKNFDPKKMITLGFGKNLPIAENETEPGRMQNRRVELTILGTNSGLNFDPYTGLSDLYETTGNYEAEGQNEQAQTAPPASPAASPTDTSAPEDVEVGVSPYD